jgi:hypothetical protein
MTGKTITLSYPHEVVTNHPQSESMWKVVKVTNSVEFAPGEFLKKEMVQELCEARTWDVKIIAPPR